MDIVSWIPSIATTAGFAAALWLARKLIATRLTSGVQHEYDRKLEAIRSDLREREEFVRADLRSKEAEIAALREAAMGGSVNRQSAVDRRRLEAVDQLWSAVNELQKLRFAASVMAGVRFDVAAERAKSEPKLQKVFQVMGSGVDASKLDLTSAHKARPYVTPVAWAYFSALSAVLGQAYAKLQILQFGVDADLIDRATPVKLVKAALPEYERYIDEHGDSGLVHLVDELEDRLLGELRNIVTGKESDRESVERAHEIIKLAKEVEEQVSSAKEQLQ